MKTGVEGKKSNCYTKHRKQNQSGTEENGVEQFLRIYRTSSSNQLLKYLKKARYFMLKNGEDIIANESDETAGACQWDCAYPISGDVLRVRKDGKWYFAGKDGILSLPYERGSLLWHTGLYGDT